MDSRRYLYLTGGKDSQKADMYDTWTNQWSTLPDLIRKRTDHASLVLTGTLYVIGGIESSIECIKPGIETAWNEFLQDESIIRFDLAAVAISATQFCFYGG